MYNNNNWNMPVQNAIKDGGQAGSKAAGAAWQLEYLLWYLRQVFGAAECGMGAADALQACETKGN